MIRTLFAATLLSMAAVLCAAASAHADAGRVQALGTSIAAEAETRAQAYQANPAALADAPVEGDALVADLTELALAARDLSRHIEQTGGPPDLRCIFFGIGEDVAAQIEALNAAATRADMSRAYAEIARLARQAAQLAAEPDLEG